MTTSFTGDLLLFILLIIGFCWLCWLTFKNIELKEKTEELKHETTRLKQYLYVLEDRVISQGKLHVSHLIDSQQKLETYLTKLKSHEPSDNLDR